ncbi:MAG TPA: hypothetical protein ENF78_05830 [Candidatus Bathyarchaeota archaeon]|nr:hypothetical protein [Candidatus Bathyarchaeota archaeon]
MREGRRGGWLYYDVHGVLRARSNVPILNDFFRVVEIQGRPDLTVFIGDFKPRGLVGRDMLRLVYRAKGVLRSEILIRGLASGRAVVLISNPAFRLLGKVSRRVGKLIKAIYYLLMLKKGHVPMHSACVEKDGRGILLTAPPETGKTLTAIRLVLEHGFRLLGDDMVILGPNLRVLADPGAMTLHPIHIKACGIRLGTRKKVEMAIRHALRRIPYVVMAVKEFKMKVDDVIGRDKIAKEARASQVFFLEEGRQQVRTLGPDEAYERLMAAGRMHYLVYENEVIQEYAYRNPELGLEGLFSRLRSLFRELVESLDCWLIRCRGKRFADLMAREGLL